MREFVIKDRDFYTNRLIKVMNDGKVKILEGPRGCGKTCVLRLYERYLLQHIEDQDRVVRINFEAIEFPYMNCEELIEYIKGQKQPNGKLYILLDEIQHISNWETAVNELYADPDCDIYLAFSTFDPLDSNLVPNQEGKIERMHLLPLSFSEFIYYHGFKLIKPEENVYDQRYNAVNDRVYTLEGIYNLYIKYGGFPLLIDLGLDVDKARVVLEGAYSTIIICDIQEQEKKNSDRVITDPILLRNIITVLAANLGNNISATGVGKIMNSNMAGKGIEKSKKHATKTLEIYIEALLRAHLFYESKRYDIQTDRYLKTLSKYYIADAGLHNYLLKIKETDKKGLLENKVFFELLRREYDVANGKIGTQEVNFIATKGDSKIYIQTTESLSGDREREVIGPLRKIRDSYPKVVIVFHGENTKTRDGIIVKNALDFLLGGSLI